jgi:hypothetical protein
LLDSNSISGTGLNYSHTPNRQNCQSVIKKYAGSYSTPTTYCNAHSNEEKIIINLLLWYSIYNDTSTLSKATSKYTPITPQTTLSPITSLIFRIYTLITKISLTLQTPSPSLNHSTTCPNLEYATSNALKHARMN